MSVAMSVRSHDDRAVRKAQTCARMIECQLTIDPSKDPVAGHVSIGEDGETTPFTGYVELISMLERARPETPATRNTGGGESE